jgi:uncharacterized protein
MRVVIDTNALVAARFSPEGAASRLLDDCIEGRVEAVVSDEIERENRAILQKVRPSREFWDRLERFYSAAVRVTGGPRLDVVEDPADNKYLECAVAGGADCIISSDRHLLVHDGFRGIRICKAGHLQI